MNTKLVYVLTCSPEATYIEQALMAIYSARHWNPKAWIVLLTDNETSDLIHNADANRGEILKYISEEIVSHFDPDKNMIYRSRWIKTQVRELVKGNFLFVDCDTICCRPLNDVDLFDCNIGAVFESHLPVKDFNEQMKAEIEEKARLVGWSLQNEDYYFSSGVIYAKDIEIVHKLYQSWHETWRMGVERGVNIDQPTLAKANIDCEHIIQLIPDSYNCILFTEPQHTKEAHILHIASFRNPSFLFENSMLNYIRKNGLNNKWIINMILEPCKTFRPFDYDILHSSLFQRLKWIINIAKEEKNYVRIVGSDCHKEYLTSFAKSVLWMAKKRLHVVRHRDRVKDNVCRI